MAEMTTNKLREKVISAGIEPESLTLNRCVAIAPSIAPAVRNDPNRTTESNQNPSVRKIADRVSVMKLQSS